MNFNKVLSGIHEEVEAALVEIEKNKDLWGYLPIRTSFEGSPHSEVVDIPLRGPEIKMDKTLDMLQGEVLCVNYPAMVQFPHIYHLCLNLMSFVRGEMLGRVVITKLPPLGKIAPHIDEGYSANLYDRYHIVLNADAGNTFIVNGEEQVMEEGEVWWVNNHVLHSVENRGEADRIHIIVDIMRYNP